MSMGFGVVQLLTKARLMVEGEGRESKLKCRQILAGRSYSSAKDLLRLPRQVKGELKMGNLTLARVGWRTSFNNFSTSVGLSHNRIRPDLV